MNASRFTVVASLVALAAAACGGEVTTDAPGSVTKTGSPTDPKGNASSSSGSNVTPVPQARVATLSKGCALAAGTTKTGTLDMNVDAGGKKIAVTLVVPPERGADARNLVLVLGDSADASAARAAFPLDKSMQNALFAYPQFAAPTGAGAGASGVSAGELLDAVVATVGAQQCFVANHVLVAGVGAGANAASDLGCQRPDAVRGIATVAGNGPSTTPCKGPVAVWESTTPSDSARATLELWLRQNRCSSTRAAGACVVGDGCYTGFPVTHCETTDDQKTVPDFAPMQVASFFAQLTNGSILE